jgi:hypothetical protein
VTIVLPAGEAALFPFHHAVAFRRALSLLLASDRDSVPGSPTGRDATTGIVDLSVNCLDWANRRRRLLLSVRPHYLALSGPAAGIATLDATPALMLLHWLDISIPLAGSMNAPVRTADQPPSRHPS